MLTLLAVWKAGATFGPIAAPAAAGPAWDGGNGSVALLVDTAGMDVAERVKPSRWCSRSLSTASPPARAPLKDPRILILAEAASSWQGGYYASLVRPRHRGLVPEE